MTRWFRFYDDAINDPKILKLSDKLYRFWVGILCVASKSNGKIPHIDDLALFLRMKPEKVREAMEHLVNSGLLDEFESTFMPHNWDRRQYKSDVTDPTAATRMQRHRNKHRNDTVTMIRPDTETDSEKKEDGATAPETGKYYFECGAIKLTRKTFDEWTLAFPNLSLRAELTSLARWAGEQPKWFHPVSAALAKRNREIEIKIKTPQQAHSRPLTRDGKMWPEGIV